MLNTFPFDARIIGLTVRPLRWPFGVKAYWLCDAPTGLTFMNFAPCHTVFVWFVLISEQKVRFAPILQKLIGFYNCDEVFTARYKLGLGLYL
jgi:hypothetical protein